MPQIDQPTKSAAIQVLIPELRIAARKLVDGPAMEIRKHDRKSVLKQLLIHL
jgi:hypothetical protein